MARARCSSGDCARGLATRSEFGVSGGTDKLDAVDICINNLHEKRRSKREAGLEGLIALLEGFVPMDNIDYRYLTIFFRCRASINTGSAREAFIAYRAIGLLALTVSHSADCSKEILTNMLHLPGLVKTLRTGSSDAAKVVAALDCLASVTFAAARRPLDVEPSLGILWSLIKNTGADSVVSATAVSLWALLLTTLGNYGTYPYAGKEATIPFRELAELLNTHDLGLLVASGEALAVCAELRLTQYASPKDKEALAIKVSDLASGATHGDNRKLNKHRFMFQEIGAIIKRGECLDEELVPTSSSQRGMLRVSKWARMVQLNFLKRFLGKGFDKHLMDNPVFRDQSNYITADEVNEQPTEKSKQQRFGREKKWSMDLRRDRMISWENKNASQLL